MNPSKASTSASVTGVDAIVPVARYSRSRVDAFALQILGRLDAGECGFRSRPLLGRQGGQRLTRALGKSIRIHQY
jgi:hypothetical protein